MNEQTVNRRQFIRSSLLTLGAVGSGMVRPLSVFSLAKPDLTIAHGSDPYTATLKAINMLGGIEQFVKRGDKVILFPNIISPSPPEFAINTNPDVVKAVAELCVKAGGSVQVYHHHDPIYAKTLGIQDRVEAVGASMAHMPPPDEAAERYIEVPVPMGRILNTIKVADLILNADVFINIPIAKHHAGSELTMAMKNLMGIVSDPRSWHYLGLHDCIADCTTAIRPDLVVMDATRILLNNGPSGPGETKVVNEVIASIDPVAVDAYGASLLKKELRDVRCITQAFKQRAGEMRLNLLTVERADV
jgi:uncharacterized protein (DUF362 family)